MAEPVYPIRFSEQLRQHLRALRKRRQLTQAQLGTLIGVSQARIAEIEAHPGAISVEQLLKILATLGVSLMLQENASEGSNSIEEQPQKAPRKKSDATAGLVDLTLLRSSPTLGVPSHGNVPEKSSNSPVAHPDLNSIPFTALKPTVISSISVRNPLTDKPVAIFTSPDSDENLRPKRKPLIKPRKGSW